MINIIGYIVSLSIGIMGFIMCFIAFEENRIGLIIIGVLLTLFSIFIIFHSYKKTKEEIKLWNNGICTKNGIAWEIVDSCSSGALLCVAGKGKEKQSFWMDIPCQEKVLNKNERC